MVNYVKKLAQVATEFVDDWIEVMAEPEVRKALRGRVHMIKLTIELDVVNAEYGGFHPTQCVVQIGCEYAHVKRLMRVFKKEPEPIISDDKRVYHFHTPRGTIIEAITATCHTHRVLEKAIA